MPSSAKACSEMHCRRSAFTYDNRTLAGVLLGVPGAPGCNDYEHDKFQMGVWRSCDNGNQHNHSVHLTICPDEETGILKFGIALGGASGNSMKQGWTCMGYN